MLDCKALGLPMCYAGYANEEKARANHEKRKARLRKPRELAETKIFTCQCLGEPREYTKQEWRAHVKGKKHGKYIDKMQNASPESKQSFKGDETAGHASNAPDEKSDESS